jgi:hypothetical protein
VRVDRRGSLHQHRYSDFNRWLGVHEVRAGNGLLRVVSSRVLLVDSLWAGARPLDVLDSSRLRAAGLLLGGETKGWPMYEQYSTCTRRAECGVGSRRPHQLKSLSPSINFLEFTLSAIR